MLLKNYGQDKKNDYTTEQLLDENLKNISKVSVKLFEDSLNNEKNMEIYFIQMSKFLKNIKERIENIEINSKDIVNKMSLDYECVKVTNWKECKEIIDNIDEINEK